MKRYKVTHYGYSVTHQVTVARSPRAAVRKTIGGLGDLGKQVWNQGFLTRFGYGGRVVCDVRCCGRV
jgi:hypothetical protein